MALLGIVIALMFFCHFKNRHRWSRHHGAAGGPGDWLAERQDEWRQHWADWNRHWAEQAERWGEKHADWHRRWADRAQRCADRELRRQERRAGPSARRGAPASSEDELLRRARRRAAAETGFYIHLFTYAAVITFLFFINMLSGHHRWDGSLNLWFLWPAFGWGLGIFFHWMGVFGSRLIRESFFDPVVDREVRREKVAMTSEKQASLDELSSTIAHEIRNPIAAAKSLVQQMEEDPQSVENIEYAKVALDELDRVERRIAHLLKFAKEEDYAMAPVNLASVVDAALTQLRGKLDAARVAAVRNYITGPTVIADAEKLKQVFANVLDNAIDAFDGVPENRRVEVFIENGGNNAVVRVRDNGCGIPADKLARIFNPFFTTKEKGTGLGMAISKKIVEAHAGAMDVVSEAGRGTEFVVSLPLPR
jgi:signal transduction histidine kinase